MDVCSGSAFGDPCRPNHDGKHWKPASKATLTPGNLKQSTPQLRPLHLGLLEHLKGVVTTTSQPETDWILQKDAVWPKKKKTENRDQQAEKIIENPRHGWKSRPNPSFPSSRNHSTTRCHKVPHVPPAWSQRTVGCQMRSRESGHSCHGNSCQKSLQIENSYRI